MANETRIVPVMVNEKGDLTIHMERQGETGISFTNLGPLDDADKEKAILDKIPEGFLSDKSAVHVKHVLTTQAGTDYYVVAGGESSFAAAPKVAEKDRWFSPMDFKFGDIPDGVTNIDQLPQVYTGSMERPDLAALMKGVQEVRVMRYPELQIPIDTPAVPLAVAVEMPEAFDAVMRSTIDKDLPPLHLPPNLGAKPNRLTMPRRRLLQLAARAVTALSKLAMRPQLDLAKAAEQLLKSGLQPKPI